MIKEPVYIYFMFDKETLHGYVGKSILPERRLKAHWNKRNKKLNYKDNWLCTLSSPPDHRILEECTGKNWEKREMYFITKMKKEGWNLTNLTVGGGGLNGCSEETKRKMSEVRKGRPAHNKGIPHSEEAKKKMSESSKGIRHSKETRRRMSISRTGRGHSFYGRTHSEATKAKISRTQLARFADLRS